jgi:hypothetical protein
VDKVIEYVDGRTLKERQIRAKRYLPPSDNEGRSQYRRRDDDSFTSNK